MCRKDLGATLLGQQTSQSTGSSPSPALRSHVPTPAPEQAEAHNEGATGREPRTFLHLLAGRGSSSVSDEVEEPSSLSVPVRKWSLGIGEQVGHIVALGGPLG